MAALALTGWRLMAVSTVYFQRSDSPNKVSGAWDNASGDITVASNLAIPDGTSGGEVTATVGPCSWIPSVGSLRANLDLQWNPANRTGYRASISKNCQDANAATTLNVYDHGSATAYWQSIS